MKKSRLLFILFPLWLLSQNNFDKAQKLFLDQKYEQAEVIFENHLKENPTDLKSIEYLGDIAGHQKNWDKAIFYYKKIKTQKPNEANYYFKYGGALAMKATSINKFKALGMIDEIKASFEKAITLNPKHIEARWALIELNLQLPAFVGGSQTDALRYSNELLKISPLDGYLSQGKIDEHFNRLAAAEKNYIKAHEIGKSKITYQMLYNLYTKKLKNNKKAQEIIR